MYRSQKEEDRTDVTARSVDGGDTQAHFDSPTTTPCIAYQTVPQAARGVDEGAYEVIP